MINGEWAIEEVGGDIYYDAAYGKLYEKMENGSYQTFCYQGAEGTVCHCFLKRPLPWQIDGETCYDLITPYGYGGPLAEAKEDKQVLAQAFESAFRDYCKENNIVCEFIRFHPLYRNADFCSTIYDVSFNRHTIALDLTDDAFFENQFHSKCRNMVRKAEKSGVSIQVDDTCETIDTFADIYYMTMKKDDADDYYFFDKAYFHTLRDTLQGEALLINAVYEEKIVAASLFLMKGQFAHYHLSATDPAYYKLAANNLILKNACEVLRQRGCSWLHLGGGLSASEEDRLYSFKRSFGREDKNVQDFYIGKKIWDAELYQKAEEIFRSTHPTQEDSGFFPVYRQ